MLCLSELSSLTYRRKENLTVYRNTTVIHVWRGKEGEQRLHEEKLNGSTMCATPSLEKSTKYQSSQQRGIIVFDSYQTKALRIRPTESEKEYRDLTLGTLYSDEVRTPLLPSFNRCGAEGQPQRPTWWSCLAGSVLRMQTERNAHQDRYTTYTIAIANPVMTRAAIRTPCTDTGIVDRARWDEMDINI